MIFNLNKNDRISLQHLFNTNEANQISANMYLDFVENFSTEVFAQNETDYIDKFLETMEIDPKDFDNQKFINNYIKNSIKKYDIEYYKNNPYVLNVKPADFIEGNIELKYISYLPYEGFIADDILVDQEFKEISQIGFFDEEYKYLSLLEDDNIWMLITPNEINTMNEYIEKIQGNVCVLGLGLGYFPYMASLKDDVKSITIIENNPKIIKIFKEKILPYFNEKTKIKIVETDAIKFADNFQNFDSIFIDLWHNPDDGLPLYYIFKNIEYKNKNIKFYYWLENGILALLRRCLITLIEEEINGSKDSNYKQSSCFTDKVINELHFLLKDTHINAYYQIEKLLSDNSLKSFIGRIKL